MKLQKNQIALISERHGALFKAADLIEAGLSFSQIRRLVASGELEKISRGMYRVPSQGYDERIEITRRIPVGVFCMYSASFLHGLSNFVPSEQHVAIPKKSRYVLPNYPPVQLYFWASTSFELGISNFQLEEGTIRVYDPEKTVCDLLRLRGKAGTEMVNEVVKNYLQRPNRELVKLHHYARELRVERTLKQYLNILL